MNRLIVVLMLTAATYAPHARATDTVYGSAALPQLTDSSSLVVVARDARALPGGSETAALFELTLDSILRGNVNDKTLTVLAPTVERPANAADFTGAAVFLRGPLSDAVLKDWKVSASGPVYQVSGAGAGVVALNAARRDAIETYMAVADAPAGMNVRVKWAERQIKSKDDFLQTSAVFEIERQKDKEKALQSLSSVVKSDQSTLSARKLAVQVIGDSPAAKATEVLKSAAENAKLPEVIRRDAVQAVSDRPDAKALIEKWRASEDVLLATEAAKTTKVKPE